MEAKDEAAAPAAERPSGTAQPEWSLVPTSSHAASAVVVVVGKKRGRPRKYAADGSLVRPLEATPISSSPAGKPVLGPPAKHMASAVKRGRARPMDFQYGSHFNSLGGVVACSGGANFTPHIINVAPGEDVTMKIISFSQQGQRAICILSANGVISNVTLRQPDSSGGTLTYEGCFELLSLSGSFMPSDNGATRSRSGGMSVSLASTDGRVVGGGVAGLLVAASPIQIVLGSFIPSFQVQNKIKKPKESNTSMATPTAQVPVSSLEMLKTCSSVEAQIGPADSKANTVNPFLSWSSPMQPAPESRHADS